MSSSKNGMQLTVTEEGAKVFRLWEELGGPKVITLDDCKELYQHELTDVERRELPTWPKRDDEKLKVHYILPSRLGRRTFFRGI